MSGWRTVKLRDVTTKIGSGATPKGGYESYHSSGVPLIRSLNVYDGRFRRDKLAFLDDEQAAKLNGASVQTGDVLINITGASVARCCAVPKAVVPARVNQHVSIVRPKTGQLLSEFLVYFLISGEAKRDLLEIGESGGTTRQAITKSQLKEFEVPLPPLAEQKRIVAILDAAFEGIDTAIANAEQNLANARALFTSTLERRMVAAAEGAERRELATLCDDRGISYGVIKLGDHVANGVPCLRTSNVRPLRLDLGGMKRIAPQLSNEYRRTILGRRSYGCDPRDPRRGRRRGFRDA